jgi:hypothetical protein
MIGPEDQIISQQNDLFDHLVEFILGEILRMVPVSKTFTQQLKCDLIDVFFQKSDAGHGSMR